MEHIVRSRHLRSTVWVFITKECTAEEVFKSKPPVANSVSEHLNSIVLMQDAISGFLPAGVAAQSGLCRGRGGGHTAHGEAGPPTG